MQKSRHGPTGARRGAAFMPLQRPTVGAALHELVFAASVRPSESQLTQTGDQFTPLDGAKVRHQEIGSTSLTERSRPATDGIGSWREMRNSSQSSKVPASSSRHASNVSACAYTPRKSGISP